MILAMAICLVLGVGWPALLYLLMSNNDLKRRVRALEFRIAVLDKQGGYAEPDLSVGDGSRNRFARYLVPLFALALFVSTAVSWMAVYDSASPIDGAELFAIFILFGGALVSGGQAV